MVWLKESSCHVYGVCYNNKTTHQNWAVSHFCHIRTSQWYGWKSVIMSPLWGMPWQQDNTINLSGESSPSHPNTAVVWLKESSCHVHGICYINKTTLQNWAASHLRHIRTSQWYGWKSRHVRYMGYAILISPHYILSSESPPSHPNTAVVYGWKTNLVTYIGCAINKNTIKLSSELPPSHWNIAVVWLK